MLTYLEFYGLLGESARQQGPLVHVEADPPTRQRPGECCVFVSTVVDGHRVQAVITVCLDSANGRTANLAIEHGLYLCREPVEAAP